MPAYYSLTQTLSATHETEKALVKDSNGNDTTAICCNEGYKATIHIVPADSPEMGGANSLDGALAQCVPPPPCSKVTLANFAIDWLNSSSWIYFGGATFDLDNNSNPVRMNLPIEYRTANDLSRVVNP